MDERNCNLCNKPLTTSQKKYCSHLCANRVTMAAKKRRAESRDWKVCDVGGCDKPARSRTAALCKMHYHRQYRYGSLELRQYPTTSPAYKPQGTTLTLEPRYVDVLGQRFGTLTVTRRIGIKWLCICACGETRLARAGDLNRVGEANTCGIKANHLAPLVEYGGAHYRVEARRGLASQHRCVDCGSPAYHWSYDHADPDEKISQAERTRGVAYSMNIDHYQARCVPCHKRFDLNHINSTDFAGIR